MRRIMFVAVLLLAWLSTARADERKDPSKDQPKDLPKTAVFATQTVAEWRRRLGRVNVPFSQIARIEDIVTDEQARSCGAVVETGDPTMPLTIAAPFRLEGAAMRKPAPGPALGADTDAILAETGLTSADISALRKKGVVA